MVTSIARQSVILKCRMQKAIMLGNYEFYYGAGLLVKLLGLDLSEEEKPEALKEHIMEQLDQAAPENEMESYLVHIIREFRPDELYDDQMKELFLWGKGEEYPWSVNIPQDVMSEREKNAFMHSANDEC